jgi:hypothetical protein
MQTLEEQQTAPEQETVDQLQQELAALTAKFNKAVLEDEGEPKKVKFPLGNFHIKIERGQTVWRNNITPPELMLLVAMHQAGAGGMPVVEFKLNQQVLQELEAEANELPPGEKKAYVESKIMLHKNDVEADPRALRNYLAGRYGNERVNKLFPGSEPQMPTTFKRAMSIGIETKIQGARLFDMQAFGGE